MMIHKPIIVATVRSLVHGSPPMFLGGVIMVPLGLAMVIGHNVWSSAPAVVVTLVGWIMLLKGLLLLFLTPEAEANLFLKDLRYEDLFYVYAGTTLVIGLYLTYVGFRAAPRRET
jgi:hypothetical protein